MAHSLSQQSARASFGHPNPQKSPNRTPKIFCEGLLKMSLSRLQLSYCHLIIVSIPLYKDIMPYFINEIPVYGFNESLLYPVFKSWQ